MTRLLIVLLLLACLPGYAPGQMGQTSPSPNGGGFPSLPGPLSPTLINPSSAEQDPATLKRRRMLAYQKMHADTQEIQALSKELNRMLQNADGQAHESTDDKSAGLAIKEARRIQKLASEVDRLMRQD